MFSDELEMLIDAAIADGEISEKERSILHKRAAAEGVDIDELDMIVDARIAKAKKARVSSQTEEDEEVNKPEAGESALEQFTKQLQEIQNKDFQDIKGSFWKGTDTVTADTQRHEALMNLISTFAIPSAKKDLIDFIVYLSPYKKASKIEGGYEADRKRAFRKRYEECLTKAQISFPGDPALDVAINGPKKEKKGFFGFGKKS